MTYIFVALTTCCNSLSEVYEKVTVASVNLNENSHFKERSYETYYCEVISVQSIMRLIRILYLYSKEGLITDD
jgi:hypothetical protein